MQERVRFIRDHRSGLYEMTELCERYGISRKTGYKWIERFENAGTAGLEDQSRAPCTSVLGSERQFSMLVTSPDSSKWIPIRLKRWIQYT
jgi:transposase